MFPSCSLLIMLWFFKKSSRCLLYNEILVQCDPVTIMSGCSLKDIRLLLRQCSISFAQSFSSVGCGKALSADKSMSHSLCLVRPNTLRADHSLLAYKWKQIAASHALLSALLLSAVWSFSLRGGACFSEANDRRGDLIHMFQTGDE